MNIKESMKNGFFIQKYYAENNKSICKVQEAWVECNWKYEANGMREIKKKIVGQQLVLVVQITDTSFNSRNYLVTWNLFNANDSSMLGEQGNSDNHVYFLGLKSKTIPDSFNIYIRKGDASVIGTIKLRKISN